MGLFGGIKLAKVLNPTELALVVKALEIVEQTMGSADDAWVASHGDKAGALLVKVKAGKSLSKDEVHDCGNYINVMLEIINEVNKQKGEQVDPQVLNIGRDLADKLKCM